MTTRTIKVENLARVEGEGALKIVIEGKEVASASLEIFEPPRFFEAFLRGRDFREVPDLTARICGICPVAYQMSSVQAMEQALAIQIPDPIRSLRRLLYCGEWIESHVLHMFLLHAPDFLGYESGIHMAKDHGDLVRQGLGLKKIGNAIVTLLGGREIHPINVKVGGFYRLPTTTEMRNLQEELKQALDVALAAARFVGSLDIPDCERDYELVALRHDRDYPMNEGRIASTKGIDIPVNAFPDHFEETQCQHSTALRSHVIGRGAYLTGPLARYSLNRDRLSPLAKEIATEIGLGAMCSNPFQSILIRAVEVIYACEEAIRIIDDYEPGPPAVPLDSSKGPCVGHGATEAPRGLLYHRYQLDPDGSITEADIVPPTSQNQAAIEDDLKAFIPDWLEMDDSALQWRCEQTVRNHDPCISCATHFLTLEIDRS